MTVSEFGSSGASMFKDLSTGFLPITMVVAIMAAVFWGGYGYRSLSSTNEQTDSRVTLITVALDEQKTAIRALVQEVADLRRTVSAVPQDAMRSRDFAAHMAAFCLKFERLNRGIRCPVEM